MGGNAIKDARRIYLPEFYVILSKINDRLKEALGDKFICKVPEFYRQKETFGDIDLLITFTDISTNEWKNRILSIFRPNQHSSNGNCLSIDIDGVQVDFIHFNSVAEVCTAYNYFSWNDLGNLLGRVAHRNGMKFGHDGLWLRVDHENQHLGYVKISDNMKTILTILGYDYRVWLNGFDTLDQIFNFVVSSPHFDSSSYQYDNLDHQNRLRNRKRKVYQAFLEWISNRKFPEPIPIALGLYETDVFSKKRGLVDNYEMSKYLKTFFNGEIITQLTGYTGKALGEFIREYKEQYDSFDVHVLSQIERYGNMTHAIMEFYNAKKNISN